MRYGFAISASKASTTAIAAPTVTVQSSSVRHGRGSRLSVRSKRRTCPRLERLVRDAIGEGECLLGGQAAGGRQCRLRPRRGPAGLDGVQVAADRGRDLVRGGAAGDEAL